MQKIQHIQIFQFGGFMINKTKNWKLRQQGDSIVHMYFIYPTAGKQYYLRMLLTVIHGAIFFKDLRTVNGIHHFFFKEACIFLGLL